MLETQLRPLRVTPRSHAPGARRHPLALTPTCLPPACLTQNAPTAEYVPPTSLPEPEDALSLHALRRRDPDAVELLFRRYRGRVTAVLLSTAGADRDLPDLVQEVFAQVLKSLPSFRGDRRSLAPWISRIAVFTARRCIRTRQRRWWLRPSDAAEGVEPECGQASPAIVCALTRAEAIIARLPAKEQLAFRKRFVEGLSLEQTAQGCNVSLATIKRWIDRARERFERYAAQDPFLADRTAWS